MLTVINTNNVLCSNIGVGSSDSQANEQSTIRVTGLHTCMVVGVLRGGGALICVSGSHMHSPCKQMLGGH